MAAEFDIDLHVDFEERDQLKLDDDLRQTWPDNGMACDVPGCNTQHFSSFSTYIKHWKKFHVATTKVVFCSKCKKKSFSRRCDLTRHLKVYHKTEHNKLNKLVAEAKSKVLTNNKFVNPGQILPRKKN